MKCKGRSQSDRAAWREGGRACPLHMSTTELVHLIDAWHERTEGILLHGVKRVFDR